jgi:type VI secretion system protein ImpK
MTPLGTGSFLLQSFRDFYGVLSGVCHGVRNGPWIASNRARDEDSVPELRRARAASIRASLLEVLEELDRNARSLVGDHGMGAFREAKYVMVALADELLLGIEWEGRELWAGDLLESQVFGTHLAGELFFKRANEILGSPREDGVELATVYLLALSLGFKGRYRGHPDQMEIKKLRSKLLAFISEGDRSPFDPKRRLFPQAHSYTLEESAEVKLPPVARWVTILIAFLLLWGAMSHVVWRSASRDLRVAHDSLTVALCEQDAASSSRAHPLCGQVETTR